MLKKTFPAITMAIATIVTATSVSAAEIRMAKAAHNPAKVYQKAQKTCGGSFSIIDSWSNAGGLFADVLPGPSTWYGIAYACGGKGGIEPTFPFRGQKFDYGAVVAAMSAASAQANAANSATHCSISANGASAGVIGHVSCH